MRNNSEVNMIASFIAETHVLNFCVSKLGPERVICKIKQGDAKE